MKHRQHIEKSSEAATLGLWRSERKRGWILEEDEEETQQ